MARRSRLLPDTVTGTMAFLLAGALAPVLILQALHYIHMFEMRYAPFGELLSEAALLVAVAGMATFAALATTRRYTAPLRRLRQQALAFGRGELDARVTVTATNEVGALATAFNQMAEVIQREEERLRDQNEVLRHGNSALSQAHDALRQSEGRYRGLVDTLRDVVFTLSEDFVLTSLNPAFESLTGWKTADWLGKRFDELVHPDDLQQTIEVGVGLLGGQLPEPVEVRVATKSGGGVVVEVMASQLIVEGRLVGILGVAHDITRRKKLASRSAALLRVASRLNAELDLQRVLAAVCEETARALAVPAVDVTLYDPAQDALVVAADFGLPPEHLLRHRPIPRAACDQMAAQAGTSFVVPDMRALATAGDDLHVALDIRTMAAARMVREDELIGCLSAMTIGASRDFDADDLSLLEGLANQAAQAISNARLHGANQRLLEETRHRSRTLQALRAVDLAVTGSLDLRVTLGVVVDQVIGQGAAAAALVLMLNRHGHVLEGVAARGFREDRPARFRIPLTDTLAGRAAFERRTIVSVDHGRNENDGTPEVWQPGDFVRRAAVPLIAKGQVKGVLVTCDRNRIEPVAEDLAFVEAVAAQAAIAVDNAALFEQLDRSHAELVQAYDATIEGWSRALDLRHFGEEGHSPRVAALSEQLGRAMDLSDADLAHLRRGALLHDIGKMGIPDAILHKQGPLSDEEEAVLRMHPVHAYELLSPITFLRPSLDVPYCHHERWDGQGYPRGLRAVETALAARIVAVADTWEVLRSHGGFPREAARERLNALAGTQLDPQLVYVFLALGLG